LEAAFVVFAPFASLKLFLGDVMVI